MWPKIDTCVKCQHSLRGGSLTLPWEEGDNPDAYITCSHCRYEDIVEEYGEYGD